MKNKIIIFIFLFTLFQSVAFCQSYINVQGHVNYWQHSEVFGPGIGFGYKYNFNKIGITINYDFGYGSVNRIKNFDNINYENWTTVFVHTKEGKWREDYLGFTGDFTNELRGRSDYGKQHQISIGGEYTIYKMKKSAIIINTGVFASLVEQFYTFDNIEIYNIDLPSAYSGPLNYIPSTTQKIYTYGAIVELSYMKELKHRTISPYLSCGLGPNYGSFFSIGARLGTQLLRK